MGQAPGWIAPIQDKVVPLIHNAADDYVKQSRLAQADRGLREIVVA